MAVAIHVKFGKTKIPLTVSLDDTVLKLKETIQGATRLEVSSQKLIASGKQLKDDTQRLGDAGIKAGSLLMVTGSSSGDASAAGALPTSVLAERLQEDASSSAPSAPVAPSGTTEDNKTPPPAKKLRPDEPTASPSNPTPPTPSDAPAPPRSDAKLGGEEREPAPRPATPPAAHKEPQNIEFERFDEEQMAIDEKTLERIAEFCSPDAPFIDPQFRPEAKSLFVDPLDAERWVCSTCKHSNPVPPEQEPPKSEAEAIALEERINNIRCANCQGGLTHVQKVRVVNRPSTWLRPGVRCVECELVYGSYGVQDLHGLVSRQCVHYIRDDITSNTVGMTWEVIRQEARPEDVMQGALGNCWFGGALSCVAGYPRLIEALVGGNKKYNPLGAYLVKLHFAGQWRTLLVDDLFPCTKPWSGKIEGDRIYYSRGGNLVYARATRHQLWVPLVEKAAAKLFGSYGALDGGTMAEALQLFTGYPTACFPMFISPEAKQRKQEQHARELDFRTQLLIQGKDPDEELGPLDMMDDNDDDILWSKMLSAKQVGYIMGLASSAEACGRTREYYVEKLGLQTPHAYGVLDVREVVHNGQLVRLLQLRNPWGERSPRTWKGDWGKDWSGWTFNLRRELGVVNASNVSMYDEMSIFWITFSDVRQYFVALSVCRVHRSNWATHRGSTAWLPSDIGPGESFEITLRKKSSIDIVLWQEKHITREFSLGARSTNVDVGFAVLRKKGTGPSGRAEWECIDYAARCSDDQVSVETILEGGHTYRVVPICIGQMQASSKGQRLRKVTLSVHCNHEVGVQTVRNTWDDLAAAVVAAARKKARTMKIAPDIRSYTLRETTGMIHVLHNTGDQAVSVQVESDAVGCITSLPSNSSLSLNTVLPGCYKVSFALTVDPAASSSQYSCVSEPIPMDWGENLGTDLHANVPADSIPDGTVPPCTVELLEDTGEEEEDEEGGGNELDAAIKLSLEMGNAGSMDVDEPESAELAEALRLSMLDDENKPHSDLQKNTSKEELEEAVRLSMLDDESKPTADGDLPKTSSKEDLEQALKMSLEADGEEELDAETLAAIRMSLQQ
eukprot:Sspe_Gene.54032::Locus_29842_Transcript_1_1_Confidence_1.000_Length_3503::g.54032::m.54032/K08582/CAPN15; calpain-15